MDLCIRKASFLKRFGAGLLDAILLCILATAIAFVLSYAFGYDSYSNELNEAYNEYELEYGVKFGITAEEFELLSDDEKLAYQAASEAVSANEELIYTYNMVVSLSVLIVTLSLLISVIALEFVVPLILKNGQTVGKKVFALCLLRTDCVKVSNFQLFVRSVFGKFTIELMVPIYVLIMLIFGASGLAGLVIVFGLLFAEIVIISATQANSLIHDLIASTAVVDMSLQRIFNSSEELIEYKNKLHAERVANSDY